MKDHNHRRPNMVVVGALVMAAVLSSALLLRGEPRPDLPVFSEKDRSYWAFQPVGEPALPIVSNSAGIHNPIDVFVRTELEGRSLEPAPPADKRTLIRRATFDLTGLPPTPEEVFAFLADESPDAYQALIDRLLASPRYGEHMARHWLDLVRYADSDGFKADKYRPEAWRYRDYVIRAFNKDIPYDRFVREQIAGGEMFPGRLDAVVATRFLRHTPDEDNQKDVQRQWTTNLQDVTEVTGEAFLGMGLRCVRCHDHKFDPILQRDYYRLQAFFAPMFPVNEIVALKEAAESGHDEEEGARIRGDIVEFEEPHLIAGRQGEAKKFPEYLKPILRKSSAEQSPLEKQSAYLAVRQLTGSDEKTRARMAKMEGWQALRESLVARESKKPDAVAVLAMGDVGPLAPPTFVGGDSSAGPEVQPGVLSILDPAPAEIPVVEGGRDTTGRRSALANWIASPENPLTARVMVNRVWQWHFGDGIVATANDFGRQGAGPSHPELLDWLARRFVESGWSVKAMHRLVMLSATYRQDSQHPEIDAMAKRDPAVRYLWRSKVRRLIGDQLRDAMLAVAGELTDKDSGRGIEGNSGCRSVFVKHLRNVPDEMLKSFDGPDMFSSCSKRYVSTTALQSLLLMNGKWAQSRAAALRKRLQVEPGRPAQVRRAYTILFGRLPHAEELATALKFLSEQEEAGSDMGLTDLCHVLLNTNEFAYVD